MNEEELIKILEDYEIFVDDDYGGSYQSIIYYDKEKKISKAHTTISALKIIEIFNKLQKENEQLKQQLKQRDNIINKTIKEINYLESNCDISNIHAQKIKQILSEGE